MTKSFKEALKARRTFYQIENKSTLSDKEIRDLIRFAVEFVPSAFNSQTTRVALLINFHFYFRFSSSCRMLCFNLLDG